jgi:hypothetical protein
MKNLSRRGFGRLLAASPLLAARAAPQTSSPEDELRAARRRLAEAAQNTAKVSLPMTAEPAFVFRP